MQKSEGRRQKSRIFEVTAARVKGFGKHFSVDATTSAIRQEISICDGDHFRCTATSVLFRLAAGFTCTFGIPYFGLISWQPSQ